LTARATPQLSFISGGLLSSITDANGNVTSYTYDSARRLSATTFPDGTNETYQYQFDGLLSSKNSYFTFTYDNLKRLVAKGYPNLSSIQYTYTGQSLTRVVDGLSGSETHTFTYDPSDRPSSVTEGGRGTVNYTYDAADRVAGTAVSSGPSATYGYDPDAMSPFTNYSELGILGER